MSSVSDVLAGFKTVLAAIDPSPQDSPAAIYEWPDDYDIMDYTTFPFIIIAQVVNEDEVWRPASQGVGWHLWDAEILICLTNGPTTRMEAQRDAEVMHEPWLLATAKILFDNQGVNGTVINIGDGRGLAIDRVGNLGWDNKIFWGIRWIVPVRQEHSLPS